jgi:hypothetical protein
MASRIAQRVPATTERTWVRCPLGMEAAMRSLVKRNGIKGVRISKDCGELLVNYPRPYSTCDAIKELVIDSKRIRTRYDSAHTEESYRELQELQQIWMKLVW